ncbi:MAG: insulinase family protein [Oscillospiraceae bacterium]|nr:insulinase family protein [Oscillospiraceae bacterium]
MTTNILIAPGVTLRALQTHKFKTGCFSVNFLRQHNRENAALDALLPSVLLRGTEKYPDMQQISSRLDTLYGSTFGTAVRRKGEVKLFGFYADFLEDCFVPGGGVFAGMMEFLEQILYHPYTENGLFCDRYVEGEKQNLIHALESNINEKRTYATSQLLLQMCQGEDYGVPRLGTVEDVEKITAESLWDHYQKSLVTCPVEIFYGGQLSPEEAARAFAPIFAHRQEAKWETYSTRFIPSAREVRELSESMDVTQGKLVIGLRTGIAPQDPDYIALSLLNTVFGGGMTSKLFLNVREKRSLCYYASSSYDRYKGIMLISSGIDFDKYEITKAAIFEELEACKQGSITEEEIQSARTQLLSALRAALDAPNRLDDFFIGQALVPFPGIKEQMQKLETLTVADLVAVARKLTLDTVYFLKGEEKA